MSQFLERIAFQHVSDAPNRSSSSTCARTDLRATSMAFRASTGNVESTGSNAWSMNFRARMASVWMRPPCTSAWSSWDDREITPGHLTLRLTAARRPRRETRLLYFDHRPSPGLSEAVGAAVAVEPVVRGRLHQPTVRARLLQGKLNPPTAPVSAPLGRLAKAPASLELAPISSATWSNAVRARAPTSNAATIGTNMGAGDGSDAGPPGFAPCALPERFKRSVFTAVLYAHRLCSAVESTRGL